MKKPRHYVSDHALVRYMERGLGLDVERLRRDLGRRVDAAAGSATGMNAVNIDGMHYRIKETTVITCCRANTPPNGKGGPRRRREIDDE
ncbi:hypothetical protein [Sagittula salina]|uniref:Uncharacterized protein n=1 Tax=Sagittula salina TaxID=2820268 RepID=A0A940S2D0_9RHOB|nr:hypothetical protein [Sagittula salina]MBP0483962.1 hypothetical protein [Sagittula salina]